MVILTVLKIFSLVKMPFFAMQALFLSLFFYMVCFNEEGKVRGSACDLTVYLSRLFDPKCPSTLHASYDDVH